MEKPNAVFIDPDIIVRFPVVAKTDSTKRFQTEEKPSAAAFRRKADERLVSDHIKCALAEPDFFQRDHLPKQTFSPKGIPDEIVIPEHDDTSLKGASLYGMIMPGDSTTETSRCVFVINPSSKIRAIIYYPLTTGRNIDEIVRLVKALQTSDEHTVATPANWTPGEKVIIPPPRTQEAAVERIGEGHECVDWYFCKKGL